MSRADVSRKGVVIMDKQSPPNQEGQPPTHEPKVTAKPLEQKADKQEADKQEGDANDAPVRFGG
jgi:hypothetical protein